MNGKILEIQEIIQSKSYRDLLVFVCREIELGFDDDVPEVLFNRDVRALQTAGLSMNDLLSTLAHSQTSLAKFSTTKFHALKDEDGDGEFPPDEPQDEKSTVVEILPMYSNFLISYMIEYILITQHPVRLETYLKTMRYPFAKKYARQLMTFVGQ